MHNNLNVAGQGAIARFDPLTVRPNAHLSRCEVLTAAAWTGVRDGAATLVASGIGFAACLGVRTLCRVVSGAHHAVAVVTATVGGAAAYAFGAGTGSEGWSPQRRWIGAGATVACVALTLYTIYNAPEQPAQAVVAAGHFGTMVYSMTRDMLQSQGRRVFPDVQLDPRRALRWEGGRTTVRHVVRLGLNVMTYTATSIALSRWVALRDLLSSDFGALLQDLGAFSGESWYTFAMRAINEGSDGLIGTVLLALFFHADLRRGQGWCSNQTDAFGVVVRRAGSRVSTNMLINALQSKIPPTNGAVASLQGITAIRGALLNLQPPRGQQAAQRPTQGGGDCLLHAAAGEAQDGPWVCTDPQYLRGSLCDAIRALANSTERNRVLEGRALVEHHLQQAVAQLNADAHVSGFVPVLDGLALLEGLPETLRTALGRCRTADERAQVAGRWLDDAAQRAPLLDSVASFYAEPRRYLPTLVLPCLARHLGHPLMLHVGSTDTLYNPAGDGPFEEAVHIRHTVSQQGEAGDHFERVESTSGQARTGVRRSESTDRLLDIARIYSTQEGSLLFPGTNQLSQEMSNLGRTDDGEGSGDERGGENENRLNPNRSPDGRPRNRSREEGKSEVQNTEESKKTN